MTTMATYDADVGAVVVVLNDSPVAGTVPFPDDTHLVDLDDQGRIVAIEILTPHDVKLDAIAERFELDKNSVARVAAMIARVMTPSTGVAARNVTFLDVEVTDVLVRSPDTASAVRRSSGTRGIELEPA